MTLNQAIEGYLSTVALCKSLQADRREAEIFILGELHRGIETAFDLHLQAIADLGLWRSYPACVYHHVRSVARLQRLRFRLYGGNGERLLRLLQRHIERAPEWM